MIFVPSFISLNIFLFLLSNGIMNMDD